MEKARAARYKMTHPQIHGVLQDRLHNGSTWVDIQKKYDISFATAKKIIDNFGPGFTEKFGQKVVQRKRITVADMDDYWSSLGGISQEDATQEPLPTTAPTPARKPKRGRPCKH